MSQRCARRVICLMSSASASQPLASISLSRPKPGANPRDLSEAGRALRRLDHEPAGSGCPQRVVITSRTHGRAPLERLQQPSKQPSPNATRGLTPTPRVRAKAAPAPPTGKAAPAPPTSVRQGLLISKPWARVRRGVGIARVAGAASQRPSTAALRPHPTLIIMWRCPQAHELEVHGRFDDRTTRPTCSPSKNGSRRLRAWLKQLVICKHYKPREMNYETT